MIYEGLSRTGEIESVKAHGGGEIAEVYGGLNEANPIFYKRRIITGTPPLSFKALGKPLSDYLISGNTVQNGTPTPSDPVDVQGCGERTGNLVEGYVPGCNINSGGELIGNQEFNMFYARVEQGKTYCADVPLLGGYFTTIPAIGKLSYDGQRLAFVASPFTAPITGYLAFRKESSYTTAMMNGGQTLQNYEPYGYKLPITCGGATKNIYIGNYPLNKSGNVADDVQYSTQTLTRRIDPETLEVLATPTTEQITVPQIPTTAGTNTLSVGTTVQPSQVSITGNIKPTT